MQRVAVGAGRLVNQICLLTLLLLAACGSPGSELPLLPDVGPPDYSLAPGDQVRIITYGEDNLTGEFRVNDSGNISLPLIGTVHAAGLTSSGLEGAVAAALRHGDLVRGPSVAVEVIGYRSIFVLGEVNKPGQYPYQPGMTVLSSIALGGGFTYRAIDDYVAIVRSSEGKTAQGRATPQAFVRPGDVIKVFERQF
ncbi:MAG TPA: polysaccharide biosynthesis/export family protein [Gemmatimonadales bacterium]|nr:polysaccharide biosynthesis/export family protein [Gemmatimonadales bacterium]